MRVASLVCSVPEPCCCPDWWATSAMSDASPWPVPRSLVSARLRFTASEIDLVTTARVCLRLPEPSGYLCTRRQRFRSDRFQMQARYVSHSAVSTGCSGVPPTAAGVFQQSGHLPAYPRRGYPEGPPRADVIHGATSTGRRTVIADLGVWPGWLRRGYLVRACADVMASRDASQPAQKLL